MRCHKKWRVKITRSEEPSPSPTHHTTTRRNVSQTNPKKRCSTILPEEPSPPPTHQGTTRRNAEAHNHVYTHTHAMRPLVEYYTLFTLHLYYALFTPHLYKGKSAKTDNLHSVMLLVLRSGLLYSSTRTYGSRPFSPDVNSSE